MNNHINANSLFNNLPLACLVLLPDAPSFTVSFVSDHFLTAGHIVGTPDLIGSSYRHIAYLKNGSVWGEDVYDDLCASLEYAAAHKKTHKFRITRSNFRDPDEQKVASAWEVQNIPVLNDKDEIQYIIHSIKDVSSEILATFFEDEAKKELNDYKFALDSTNVISITDQHGIISYVNNAFCEVSKYRRQDLIGQDHNIIGSGYHEEAYFKELWDTVAKGKVWKGDIMNKAKDGSYYWMDTTVIPFMNAGAKPHKYLSVQRDITEQKKAMNIVYELNSKLMAAQQIANLGYWSNDLLGNIKWSNELYAIFEQVPGEIDLTFENVLQQFHPEDRHLLLFDINELPDGYVSFENRIITGNGRIKWLQQRLHVVRNEKGIPVRIEGTAIDITDMKEKECQLKESKDAIEKQNQALKDIAWTQSHVMRAPIARLLGLLEVNKNEDGMGLTPKELTLSLGIVVTEIDEIIHSIVRKTEALNYG